MKIRLLGGLVPAVLLAGVPSVQAQSNVTLYGAFDVGYFSESASGASRVSAVMAANPSAWGFAGTEDLGNGLKSIFRLEGGFNPSTGAASQGGRMFGRQSYLGLSGDFGTVTGGRLQGPGRNFLIKYGPSTSALDPTGNLAQSNGHLNSPFGVDASTTGVRLDNAVAYTTPKFKGFSSTWVHSFAQNGTTTNSVNANSLSLNYSDGPLSADYVFTKTTPNKIAGLLGVTEHQIGMTYDFGVVNLLTSLTTHRVDQEGANGTDRLWNIVAKVPFGAVDEIQAVYARLDKASNATVNVLGNTKYGTPAGLVGVNTASAFTSDADGVALVYLHKMSKRTTLYAGYGRISNKGEGTRALILSPGSAGGASSAIGMGIMHSF